MVVLINFARSGNNPVPEGCAMYESPLKRVPRRAGVGMFSVVVVGTHLVALAWECLSCGNPRHRRS